MSNVGFVGLGIMGKPMALNLIKGGHTLYLHSRSGVPQELTSAGGNACASAKERKIVFRAGTYVFGISEPPCEDDRSFGTGSSVVSDDPPMIPRSNEMTV